MMKFKEYIVVLMLFIASVIGFMACDDEAISKDDFEWKEKALTIVKLGEFENFFYATNSSSFIVDELDITISVIPASQEDTEQVDKLAIYVYFLEKNGEEQTTLGGEEGKLLRTFSEGSDFSKINETVSIVELYNLFESEFTNKNRPEKMLVSDLVQLKWVITDKSGKVTDTRFDCTNVNCSYIFGVDEGYACPNNLAGVLNYEVLEKGTGATGNIGKTGTVTITRTSLSGDYLIDDCQFGTSYNGKKFGCSFSDENCSNLIALNESLGTKWEITNINGASCDIKWTYRYTAGYDEWAKVRVTRADGQDWPVDLKGEGPY